MKDRGNYDGRSSAEALFPITLLEKVVVVMATFV